MKSNYHSCGGEIPEDARTRAQTRKKKNNDFRPVVKPPGQMSRTTSIDSGGKPTSKPIDGNKELGLDRPEGSGGDRQGRNQKPPITGNKLKKDEGRECPPVGTGKGEVPNPPAEPGGNQSNENLNPPAEPEGNDPSEGSTHPVDTGESQPKEMNDPKTDPVEKPTSVAPGETAPNENPDEATSDLSKPQGDTASQMMADYKAKIKARLAELGQLDSQGRLPSDPDYGKEEDKGNVGDDEESEPETWDPPDWRNFQTPKSAIILRPFQGDGRWSATELKSGERYMRKLEGAHQVYLSGKYTRDLQIKDLKTGRREFRMPPKPPKSPKREEPVGPVEPSGPTEPAEHSESVESDEPVKRDQFDANDVSEYYGHEELMVGSGYITEGSYHSESEWTDEDESYEEMRRKSREWRKKYKTRFWDLQDEDEDPKPGCLMKDVQVNYGRELRTPNALNGSAGMRRIKELADQQAERARRKGKKREGQGADFVPSISNPAAYSFGTSHNTGGEGAWKPVITCWVHLELMCIFPTM